MTQPAVKDGLSETIERHVPKVNETEICFFPEPGSFVRMRGTPESKKLRMHAVLHQVTYRCGLCGSPIVDSGSGAALDKHLDLHISESDFAGKRGKKS